MFFNILIISVLSCPVYDEKICSSEGWCRELLLVFRCYFDNNNNEKGSEGFFLFQKLKWFSNLRYFRISQTMYCSVWVKSPEANLILNHIDIVIKIRRFIDFIKLVYYSFMLQKKASQSLLAYLLWKPISVSKST